VRRWTICVASHAEEIRAQYYKEVKRFLSIPANFRGVSSTGDAFKNMSRANSKGLAVVRSAPPPD
jgi:hypothetical protein